MVVGVREGDVSLAVIAKSTWSQRRSILNLFFSRHLGLPARGGCAYLSLSLSTAREREN